MAELQKGSAMEISIFKNFQPDKTGQLSCDCLK